MTTIPPDPASPPTHGISLGEATRVFARIGLQSFGGPAGQIALMHRVLVDDRKWLSESRFLHALNYCMLLPGPEAMQLATYAGWLLHRTRGGLIAGALFVLPGFVAIFALSVLYVGFNDLTLVQGIFFGVKPAVLAIVLHAAQRIARRTLRGPVLWAVAIAAFVAIFAFNIAFPIVIASAAIFGFIGARWAPEQFTSRAEGCQDAQPDRSVLRDTIPPHASPSLSRALHTLTVWLIIWWMPTLILWSTLGAEHVFVQQCLFFSLAAVVTFGGAYSVLAFVAQQAVQVYQWLLPGEMLDGLGMAETTPGPLIQVVQYVGFMGAFRDPGALNPYLAAACASLLVTWVTFAPCFLWVFLGAPYMESLRGNRALSAGLTAITAAVVGVIVNLGIWFAMHTLFASVDSFNQFGLQLPFPALTSFVWPAGVIALVAVYLVFVRKSGMLTTLGVCAALGIFASWVLSIA